MSQIQRFAAYAAAFEQAYENDDWSDVEAFFSDDAVYEVGLPMLGADRREGRSAIIEWFKEVLDRFDRRFETRTLTLLEGPEERSDEVWIKGTATYTAQSAPDFVLELTETIRFAGEQIVHLEDRYTPEMLDATVQYIQQYGDELGFAAPD